MIRLKYLVVLCVCAIGFHSAFSQETFLIEKQGAYSYINTITSRGAEYLTFGGNVETLSDYFHNNIPIMKANKGFDLSVSLTGYNDVEYNARKWNYGLRGELNFDFRLFLKVTGGEGKWEVEPPHWSLEVNNTEMCGHGGMLNEGKEGSLLAELFSVFPLVKEIAPGVRYYDCEARTCGNIVVFNPDRPDYWLPVNVREVVQAKLEFFKDDPGLFDYIKTLYDKMSEEELNSPAFNQSDDGILNVNGKGEGLQYMRFNEAYWDKSLPASAIQLLTFVYYEYGYSCFNKDDQKMADEEFLINNGHINYSSEITKSFNFIELTSFIQGK